MKKRLSCLLLVLCFAFSNISFAFALTPESKQKRELLDTFEAEHYEMAAYREGDMIYVITVFDDGRIELAFAQKEGDVRTIWFDTEAVAGTARKRSVIDDSDFAADIIDYGMANRQESSVALIAFSAEGIPTRGYVAADQNYLLNLVYHMYGIPHTNFNWTGMTSQTVDGLIYHYKENLSIGMVYRNMLSFYAGVTLGAVVAGIIAKVGGTTAVIMTVVKRLLGIAGGSTTLIEWAGCISTYYGSMVRNRFVMINGAGPYFQCYHTVDYNGWVHENEETGSKDYEIEIVDDRYSHDQSVFSSYVMQRSLAYENYN